ncbi:MAG: hypothetical protein D6761_11525 [Candidatus Dadabacteria bacterium]|nr:MAG: hypothetical protein D6761_11525 [Candidatus Dadabacteria bacterium]
MPGIVLTRMTAMVHADHYDMSAEEWATVVYLMLFRFCEYGSEREQLIEALKPLYFARSLSFDYKTWRYSIRYAEEEIRQQMRTFHWLRPWLYGLFCQRTRSRAARG